MCGINGYLSTIGKISKNLEEEFINSADNINHRGPDKSTSINLDTVLLNFKRLAIMDITEKGDQPFISKIGERVIYTMCNGEIYNHHEITKNYNLTPNSGSDCEVIHLLYEKYGPTIMKDMCQIFNSEHAFAILDYTNSDNYTLFLSSDRFGIRPLFIAQNMTGFYFSSELSGLACLKSNDSNIERFRPRTFAKIDMINGSLSPLQYYEYYSLNNILPEKNFVNIDNNIVVLLEDAVIQRLESDRPLGCLLSGGLDSSLVSAIAARELKKLGLKLRTFSIGMTGGTDEKFAKMVAKHINSDHTHITVREEDFIDAIPKIIRTIGSYDLIQILFIKNVLD